MGRDLYKSFVEGASFAASECFECQKHGSSTASRGDAELRFLA